MYLPAKRVARGIVAAANEVSRTKPTQRTKGAQAGEGMSEANRE